MLRYLICLFLIAKSDDRALIENVKNTIGICSDIVDAVGDFLDLFGPKGETRRLGRMVKTKLETCSKIIEAVDAFHHHHFSSNKRGLIDLDFDEARFLRKSLKAVNKKLGKTLYVASKDGDQAGKFQRACANQGPTVLIVQSTTGSVFGGYTDVNWGGSKGYKRSTKSFLFRLRPAMTKYAIKSKRVSYAVEINLGAGPVFGGGHDIFISYNALSNKKSNTNGGHTYSFPSSPNHQLNDGMSYFQVTDYVALKAIQL